MGTSDRSCQGGTRGNIVAFLWEHVVVKHLHTVVRVDLHGDEAAGEFAVDGKYLIDNSPDIIKLPENLRAFVHNIDELVSNRFTFKL